MTSILLSIALMIAIFEMVIIKSELNKEGFDLALALGRSTGILIGIAFRLLAFPFVSFIILLGLLKHWICLSVDFLLTGGELIIYNSIVDKKTIRNYLEELIKNQNKDGEE